MRRVYHERCDLEESVRNQHGDSVWTPVASNVPCEMTPLSSAEKIKGGITLTDTQYQWAARSDAPKVVGSWRLVWRNKVFTFDGPPEETYIGGRLQQYEAVVKLDPEATMAL